MKDVAEEAHVSVGTVSNYINGKTVRPEVSKNIEKAIKKLKYVRNNTARFLKTQRSPFVIFVIPTVWSPYFSELTFWMQKYLDKYGYKMILCISENEYEREKGYVQMAEEQRVAGIISVSYSDLTEHINAEIPVISIEKETTGEFSLVSSDNYAGGALAAKVLRERNVSKYYFVGSNNSSSISMNARKSGFLDYCDNHGLDSEVLNASSPRHKEEFKRDLEKITKTIIFNDNFGHIGIFTHTDEVGLALLQMLNKYNVKVPQDVQLIGFDGWRFTQEDTGSISSIRQPIEKIASVAVKELDKEIRHLDTNNVDRIKLPVTFKQGSTTLEKG